MGRMRSVATYKGEFMLPGPATARVVAAVGDEGLENRRVALVIDHAAIATDQIAMP